MRDKSFCSARIESLCAFIGRRARSYAVAGCGIEGANGRRSLRFGVDVRSSGGSSVSSAWSDGPEGLSVAEAGGSAA